jgi:transcriptional regulator with XRE-family HTH domain
MVDIAQLIQQARRHSGLSKSAFARAAGTSRAALDQIEKGQRVPRTDTLFRAIRSAGLDATITLTHVTGPPDPIGSLASACAHIDPAVVVWSWRWLVGDFVANEFVPASRAARALALAEEPPALPDPRWDVLVAGLAEHLAFHADLPAPPWTRKSTRRAVEPFWWPVHTLPSQRPAALALSPAAFKRRGILVDGREIPRVIR